MATGSRTADATSWSAEGALPQRVGAWVDPDTREAYPFNFEAYRRVRLREERYPARHVCIDHVSARERLRTWPCGDEPEVSFTPRLRAGTSPRMARIVARLTRELRRGTRPVNALSRTAGEFGLAPARLQALLRQAVVLVGEPHEGVTWQLLDDGAGVSDLSGRSATNGFHRTARSARRQESLPMAVAL